MKSRKWLFPLILAAGVALFALSLAKRSKPVRAKPEEKPRVVRVIAAPEVTVVPRAVGHGEAQPARTWQAVAEVKGRILEIHPNLKQGAFLPEGEVVALIEPAAYELAVASIRAELAGIAARLAELAVQEKNAQASLAIEEEALRIAGKDLQRKRDLLRKKAVSKSSVDQAERDVLGRRQSVQAQVNALNAIPAERKVLEAESALKRVALDQALLDLDHTVLIAPFPLRVGEVKVERAQYVGVGQVLVSGDGLEAAEVVAQIPPGRLSPLLSGNGSNDLTASNATETLPGLLGLKAEVRFRTGDRVMTWPARFSRIFDRLDPQTRTVGVVVTVDDPYKNVRPGVRPPLTRNMFVEVAFEGRPKPHRVVIPRTAVHNGAVHLVSAEGRLDKRPVEIAFRQGSAAVVGSGVSPGERVVVSDLTPAVPGMRLDPRPDEEALARLLADAGEAPR